MGPSPEPLDRARFDAAFDAALARAWRLAVARGLRGFEAEAFAAAVLEAAFERVVDQEDTEWQGRVLDRVAIEASRRSTPAPASPRRQQGRR